MRASLLIGLCLASSLVAAPAFADLKCGDGKNSAPFAFGDGELVTTWGGPIPQRAKVTFASAEEFNRISHDMGPDIPRDFPANYGRNLHRVETFNMSISWTLAQFIDTERHYGFVIDRDDEALPVFEKYAQAGNNFVTVAVQHPSVVSTSGSPFNSCSVVLQRGVIAYADGKETLYLRSYFHSQNRGGDAVNFAPQGGLKITFPTQDIWFPLSLTKVMAEPVSYVVLDILTPEKLAAKRLPASFHADGEGKPVSFEGRRAYAMRVTATLRSGKDVEDFRMTPR